MKTDVVSLSRSPECFAAFGEDPRPLEAEIRRVGPEQRMAVLRAALHLTVPIHRGRARRTTRDRVPTAYLRWLALLWTCTPDLVQETSVAAFAKAMGVSRQRLEYHCEYWQALLAGEHPAAREVQR